MRYKLGSTTGAKMTDAKTLRRADYAKFRLETAEELMQMLRSAESVAKNDPAFSHYELELSRLRNHLSLQIENTLRVL
jgi:hypothetical protein